MTTSYSPIPPATKPSVQQNRKRSAKARARSCADNSRKTRLRERIRGNRRSPEEWWDLEAREALEAVGLRQRSFKYGYCTCRAGAFPCNQALLCGLCRFTAAARVARNYIARIVLALEDNPNLTLPSATFGVGEGGSYSFQASSLIEVLTRVRRRKWGSWSEVAGLVWIMEPAKGLSVQSRAHLHCILLVDGGAGPHCERQLALAYATKARRVVWPDVPWDPTKDSDSLFRTLRRQSQVEPLWAFTVGQWTGSLSGTSDKDAIVDAAWRTIGYARKSGGLQARGDLRDLRPSDLVEVMLDGRRKAGVTGVLRGLPKELVQETMHRLYPDGRIPRTR